MVHGDGSSWVTSKALKKAKVFEQLGTLGSRLKRGKGLGFTPTDIRIVKGQRDLLLAHSQIQPIVVKN
jgi:hypothetical protein